MDRVNERPNSTDLPNVTAVQAAPEVASQPPPGNAGPPDAQAELNPQIDAAPEIGERCSAALEFFLACCAPCPRFPYPWSRIDPTPDCRLSVTDEREIFPTLNRKFGAGVLKAANLLVCFGGAPPRLHPWLQAIGGLLFAVRDPVNRRIVDILTPRGMISGIRTNFYTPLLQQQPPPPFRSPRLLATTNPKEAALLLSLGWPIVLTHGATTHYHGLRHFWTPIWTAVPGCRALLETTLTPCEFCSSELPVLAGDSPPCHPAGATDSGPRGFQIMADTTPHLGMPEVIAASFLNCSVTPPSDVARFYARLAESERILSVGVEPPGLIKLEDSDVKRLRFMATRVPAAEICSETDEILDVSFEFGALWPPNVEATKYNEELDHLPAGELQRRLLSVLEERGSQNIPKIQTEFDRYRRAVDRDVAGLVKLPTGQRAGSREALGMSAMQEYAKCLREVTLIEPFAVVGNVPKQLQIDFFVDRIAPGVTLDKRRADLFRLLKTCESFLHRR